MTIDELKNMQLKIIHKSKSINTIFIILYLVIFAFTLFLFIMSKAFTYFFLFIVVCELVFVVVIAEIVKMIIVGDDIRIFKKEFKNVFVLNALNKSFDNIKYIPENGIDKITIENTGMMNTGDRYTSNDFVSGTYKGINFIQSDIHIEEEREIKDTDGNERTVWETIFLGRWMIFDFNKNFKANIRVSSSYFNGSTFLWGKKYKRVKLEDEEFNKKFSVYSENEHEAFYVLTPHFMEKLKRVKQELNCEVMFCFIDNKLHIAISNNTDSFEPNVYKIINEEEIENKVTKDIKLITDLVTDLNLDNDLFKME